MKLTYYFLLFILSISVANAQEFVSDEIPVKSKLTIKKQEDKFQLINEIGQVIISDIDSLSYYDNSELYIVQKKDNWGIVSKYGKLLIPFEFDRLELLYNYFWIVEQDNKKGLYNVYKGPVLPVEFNEIQFTRKFGQELIVNKSGKYGVFDTKGNVIVPTTYSFIENEWNIMVIKNKDETNYLIGSKIFSDSLVVDKTFEIRGKYPSDTKVYYVLYENEKYGIIDSECNKIIEPKYQDILFQRFIGVKRNNSFIYAKMNNLWGVIDINDKSIISNHYHSIESIDSTLLNNDFFK